MDEDKPMHKRDKVNIMFDYVWNQSDTHVDKVKGWVSDDTFQQLTRLRNEIEAFDARFNELVNKELDE